MIKNLLTERIAYKELPLAPIESRYFVAVENAIRKAWAQMRSAPSGQKVCEKGIENEVTILLEEELETLRVDQTRNKGSFSESVFCIPIRGGELISYDGKHLTKSPDLVFRLKNRRPGLPDSLSRHDAIFVECKLLTNSATLGDYGNDGILRFVKGEYAWAVRDCIMIAYVRTKKALPSSLTDHLCKNNNENLTKYQVEEKPKICRKSMRVPHIYYTIHRRDWKYPLGNNPGNITIRHLWLPV